MSRTFVDLESEKEQGKTAEPQCEGEHVAMVTVVRFTIGNHGSDSHRIRRSTPQAGPGFGTGTCRISGGWLAGKDGYRDRPYGSIRVPMVQHWSTEFSELEVATFCSVTSGVRGINFKTACISGL